MEGLLRDLEASKEENEMRIKNGVNAEESIKSLNEIAQLLQRMRR